MLEIRLFVAVSSLRTTDVLPVVASLPVKFFGGREATRHSEFQYIHCNFSRD